MATTNITLTANSGWVSAGATGALVQNTQGAYLHVTVQDAAPAVDAAYHVLQRGEAFVVTGTGTAYVRNPESYDLEVPVTE